MIVIPASFFSSHPQFAGYRCGPSSCGAPQQRSNTRRGPSARCSAKRCTPKNVSRLIANPHISSMDSEYEISMDVPGIKVHDISIQQESSGRVKVEAIRRRVGQPKEITYRREFALNPKTMGLEDVTADLADGVLTIHVPKKPVPQPFHIPVVSEEPPEDNTNDEDDDKNVSVTLELPGVKIEHLTITAKEDQLSIVAERKVRGTSSSVMKRSFSVDEDAVDLNEAKAYLQDGLLTIVAPKKVERDEEAVDNRPRFIAVSVDGNFTATKNKDGEDEHEEEEEHIVKAESQEEDVESTTEKDEQPNTSKEALVEVAAVKQAEKEEDSNTEDDEEDVVIVEDVGTGE